MNIRDLEYVTAIDRYRNFGRAAKACHVSQPSLSAQIKKLEERLGVDLFVRSTSGVQTTDAGVRIVDTAKEVLRHTQRIRDTAAEYHDPLAAPLRIGIIPTIAPFLLPYLNTTVAQVAEELETIYHEATSQKLLSLLDDRSIDIALLSGPTDRPGYDFTPIFRDPLLLMVADGHRLSNHEAIAAEEVPREEMFLLANEHCLSAGTTALFQDKNIGIDTPDAFQATSLLTMSHYLTPQFGCALVPSLSCKALAGANPKMRFLRVKNDAYVRDIGFVSRKGCPRHHILQAVCDRIRMQPPEGVSVLDPDTYHAGHHQ